MRFGVTAAIDRSLSRRAWRGPLRACWWAIVAWAASSWLSLAKANPDQHWRTAQSEHFVIHYPAGTEHFAARVLATGERAYERLRREFAHEVRQRIEVAVNDAGDSANGSANSTPFARINVNTVAPDALSALATHDDWVDVLVTHELTHVFHLDISHGIPEWTNKILGLGGLGKYWAPNQLAPRWLVEGVATHEESRFTSQGRYRSALFDSMIRMAVLEGRFPTLAQASNEARIFPHGSSAYLYGLHFVRFLSDRYGQEKLTQAFHDYGRRVVPFGFGRMMSRAFGATMEQLWREFEEDAHQRFFGQAREIRSAGLQQGRRLTFSASGASSGQHMRDPVWSPDGKWIYYFQDPSHEDGGIFRLRIDHLVMREGVGTGNQGATQGPQPVYRPMPSTNGIDWIAGKPGHFIFVLNQTYDRRYSWNDLYQWSGRSGARPAPLTFGMRTRDPDVSPDGHEVVFVRNDAGLARLAFLDLRTKNVTEVAPVDRDQVVYDPTFSPDGESVAYAMWLPGGYRDLYLYDRQSGANRRLTFGRQSANAPTFSPDGRYLLFSADWDGVFNLWAFDLQDNSLYQVTNVLGGAMQPAISPDGQKIVYLGTGSDGHDLWLIPFDPTSWRRKEPFDANPDPSPWLAGTDDNRSLEQAMLRSRRYRAYRTLFPRTINLAALQFQSSSFLQDFSLSLGATDVLGFHSWSGTISYLPEYRRYAGALGYEWRRFLVSLALSASRGVRPREGFVRWAFDSPGQSAGKTSGGDYWTTNYLERYSTLAASLFVPVLRESIHRVSASVGYEFGYYENLDQDKWQVDPNAPAPTLPEIGKVGQMRMSLAYSNIRSTRFATSDERGRASSLSLTVYHPALASDYSDLRLSLSHAEYLAMPWRGHQVLLLRLQGGLTARGFSRTGFSVGGLPPMQDVVRAAANRAGIEQIGLLRGYAPEAFRGRYFTVLNAEYRAPIVDLERGFSMIPVYLTRVLVSGFSDWGLAYSEPLQPGQLAGSVGASLILDLRMGYRELIEVYFQFAHGLDRDKGLDYFRVFVGRTF